MDYGYRAYDSRTARFISVDPLTKQYPWYTPYQYAGNKPIAYKDRDGQEEEGADEERVEDDELFSRKQRTLTDDSKAPPPMTREEILKFRESEEARRQQEEENKDPLARKFRHIADNAEANAKIRDLKTSLRRTFGFDAEEPELKKEFEDKESEKDGQRGRPKTESKKPSKEKSINNLNDEIKRGKAPKSIKRFDKGGGPHQEKDHVHFKDGGAMNKDGSWKHSDGRPLSNEERDFLQGSGWLKPQQLLT